jgi:TIR domain
MPYLAPHFDYDVFMSYAHGGRGAVDPPLRRWSQALIDRLKADILSLFTEFDDLAIWDDRSIDPTAALTEELRNKVERACLLLIVMSPRYLASAWCTDELRWFESQFAERRKGPGRIFIVRAVSTDRNTWPRFLKDDRGHPDLGFRFHRETDEAYVEPYGWPDLVDRNADFYRALAALRTTLVQRLREIKKDRDRQAAPVARTTAASAARPPRLYLHARPEYDTLRANVSNELRAAGCNVVTPVALASGGSLADWTAESRSRIEAAQRCDALTLLRASTDSDFEDELLDIAGDERERMSMARGAPLPCAVLDASRAPFPMADFARSNSIALFTLGDPAWSSSLKAWVNNASNLTA